MSSPSDGNTALTERPSLGTRIRARLRPPRKLRFTREGRYFIAISLGIGLAAINTGNNLLYLLLGWLLSFIIASGLLSERVLRGLRIRRRPPPRVFANVPFLMEISVENTKRSLASYSIEIEDLVTGTVLDKKCYFLKVPAGRTQRTSYRHTFARRGAYRFNGFRIGTKFPFALFRKSRDVSDEARVLVYPRVYPVAVLAPRAQHLGAHAARQMGRRGEFFGLREFREGDDQRDIHWRSTARSGRPLVREFEEESERRTVIIIDNSLSEAARAIGERRAQERKQARKKALKEKAAEPTDTLTAGSATTSVSSSENPQLPDPHADPDDPVMAMERTISAAASMASAYLSKNYAVELIARGRRVPMSPGAAQLARILEALALLEVVTDETPFSGTVNPRLENILFFPKHEPTARGRPGGTAHTFPVD